MAKPIILILVVALIAGSIGWFAGYQNGTKTPTVGDCVNSFFKGK